MLASEHSVPKAVTIAMGYVALAPGGQRYPSETDIALKRKVPEA